MKRKQLSKQPGLGDFKNKCSDMVKQYDAKIVRVIYEAVHEKVYWKGIAPSSIQKEILQEVKLKFSSQKVSVMHLNQIVSEMLSYFGKFLILLDFGRRKVTTQ